MEIRSVALIGAGAVGAYFIQGFMDCPEVDFHVIAEGGRLERLKDEGLVINGRVCRPSVKTPEELKAAYPGGPDLLIVSVKYHGLKGSLDAIRTITGPDTVVLSVLNGIDSEEIIGGVIDPAQIVYSLMRISSERVRRAISFVPETTPGVYIGEKGCSERTPRIRAIEEVMALAGLGCHFQEDIIYDQWEKYLANIEFNLPQAILGVGYGAYFDSEHVAFIRHRLEAEVCAVAEANGVHLYPERVDWSGIVKNTARFSTLQDLDAGRHTEIEMFLGVLIRKAAEAGIAVPFSEYTYHAIKALEEKNDGKFDY